MTPVTQAIPQSRKGSALLAALCFSAVLGIALASYVGVCYHALQTSTRTNSATHSFELAETGLEEAIGALNRYGYDSTHDWSDWTINGTSTATKTLSGFSFGNNVMGAVTIVIQNYNGRSTGLDPVVTVTGVTSLGDGTSVTRKLRASAKLTPLFVNAVAATVTSSDAGGSSSKGVRFLNAGTIDSLDSGLTVPTESEQQALFFSAIVSSGNGVTFFDTQLKGFVAAATETPTAPDSPAPLKFTYSGSASVAGPVPSAAQIDQARLSSSPYQPLLDIKVPSAGNTLPSGTVTIGSLDPAAGELIYRADELKLASETLTIEGKVILVVSGDFSISGAAQIVVGSPASPDASLQIVVKGASSTLRIGGNGILNFTNRAKNLAIFYESNPDPSSTENAPVISTETDFCGVVYAPNCNLDFTVYSNLKFTGSLVAKTVTFFGTPAIHYDLDLRKPSTKFSCLETPFSVSSWQEITP